MNWIDKAEITVYNNSEENSIILHSPLARRSTEISKKRFSSIYNLETVPDDLKFLVDYIPYDDRPAVKDPSDYTLFTVLPNNRCNFACSYCYSAGCRDGKELDTDVLNNCIDFFIENKKNQLNRRRLTISFMGGGEPMLSWNVIKQGVEYASQKAIEKKVKLGIRIITNGSLLNDEQIDFIVSNHIGISVSFEILENIQNFQRRHFNIVDSNLRKLLSRGVDTQLNITITPANVSLMEETYKTMRQRYPSITNAMFEPVTSEEMFDSPTDMRKFYNSYISGFINIYKLGKQQGIDITSFPYLRTVYPVKRACPGEFCITAEGKIIGCYCVSNASHPLFHKACYGDFSSGKFIFDYKVYKELLSHNKESKPECKQCSARWSCGGGCWHMFNSYSELYRQEVCEFTRKFVEQIIRINLKINNEL